MLLVVRLGAKVDVHASRLLMNALGTSAGHVHLVQPSAG